MKITKYGHCCLLIEIDGRRVLTDPGKFSAGHEALTELDVILITHEHADHLHTASLKTVLQHNPQAVVLGNESVSQLLTAAELPHEVIADGDVKTIKELTLEAFEGPHVEIIGEYGLVQNTGFLVGERFFYPGDAYTVPKRPVDVLALPVAGPWCKLSEAINYALTVAPRVAIPVHDATLSEFGKAVTYPHGERELEAAGINFTVIKDGESAEL